MDVIMVGPWMVSVQNGLDHGRHHGWVTDALFQNGLDLGRHHGWALDALFSEQIRPWMSSSWLGRGWSLFKTD